MSAVPSFRNWQQFMDAQLKETTVLKQIQTNVKDETAFLCIWSKELVQNTKWIEDYFDKVASCPSNFMKSEKEAGRCRERGNGWFRKKQYTEAVTAYSQGILYAVHPGQAAGADEDTSQLALCYANRSAALFRMHQYEKCLADTEECLRHRYPRALCCKVLLRQTACLSYLHDVTAARASLQRARQALTDMQASKVESSEKEMAAMEEELSKKKETPQRKAAKSSEVIPTIEKPHKTIVQASECIDVAYTAEKGRHVMCRKQVRAGEALVVERPYAALLLPEYADTRCNHCYEELTHVFYPCRQCREVRYCSVKCESQAWCAYHSIECPYQHLLHSIGVAHLSLRIVLIAGLNNLLCIRNKLKSSEPSLVSKKRLAGVTEEGIYGCNYRAMYELLPGIQNMHHQDIFHYGLTACLLLRLLERAGYFSDFSTPRRTTDQHPDTADALVAGLGATHLRPHSVRGLEHSTGHHLVGTSVGACACEEQSGTAAPGHVACSRLNASNVEHVSDSDPVPNDSDTSKNDDGSVPQKHICDKIDLDSKGNTSSSCNVYNTDRVGQHRSASPSQTDHSNTDQIRTETDQTQPTNVVQDERIEDRIRRIGDEMGYSVSAPDIEQAACLSQAEVTQHTGALLMRHMCQLVCNAHAISGLEISSISEDSATTEEEDVRIATAIYPTASLLNHSCQPNIIATFHGNLLVVRAMEDTKPGEELCNNYGPHYLRMPYEERRRALWSQYRFTCRCPPCTQEADAYQTFQAFKCPRCGGPLAAESAEADTEHQCRACSLRTRLGPDVTQRFVLSCEKQASAVAQLSQGDCQGAARLLRAVVTEREALLYPYNRNLGEAYDLTAKALATMGSNTEALAYKRKSMRITRQMFGATNIETGHELFACAELAWAARDFRACAALCKEALGVLRIYYTESRERMVTLREMLEAASRLTGGT